MNKQQIQTLKTFLFEAEIKELKKLESLAVPAGEHSTEFNTKMSELVEKMRKKEASFVRMNLKKILIAATVTITIIMLFVACTFVPQIKDFFVKVLENHTLLEFEGENQNLDIVYKLYYTPHGYELTNESIDSLHASYMYKNKNDMITFKQTPLLQIGITMDTEENEYTTCNIDGYKVYKASRNGYYVFAWINDNYSFSLTCPTSIPWDEIERIILEIAPVEE